MGKSVINVYWVVCPDKARWHPVFGLTTNDIIWYGLLQQCFAVSSVQIERPARTTSFIIAVGDMPWLVATCWIFFLKYLIGNVLGWSVWISLSVLQTERVVLGSRDHSALRAGQNLASYAQGGLEREAGKGLRRKVDTEGCANSGELSFDLCWSARIIVSPTINNLCREGQQASFECWRRIRDRDAGSVLHRKVKTLQIPAGSWIGAMYTIENGMFTTFFVKWYLR